MLIGYSKVIPNDKYIYKHIEALIKIGVDMRNIYQDKVTDNVNENTKLQKMLDDIQEGDIVVVTEIVKLCGNIKELLDITRSILNKKANIVSLKEEWYNTTQSGKHLLEILDGIAGFEKDLLSEKTKLGLAIAKEKGRAGGRPRKCGQDVEQAMKLYMEKKHSVRVIEDMTGVSKATLYRYLKNNNLNTVNENAINEGDHTLYTNDEDQ